MKFCVNCQNMLYISINPGDETQLTYYCRNCGSIDETIHQEGHCVLTNNLKKSEQQFSHIINQYTKLDPTLPRIYTMKCPNSECITNKDPAHRTEVIYMRYDDQNMKYVYLCVDCDTVWNK